MAFLIGHINKLGSQRFFFFSEKKGMLSHELVVEQLVTFL